MQIRIFDLQIECSDHEAQHRKLHQWLAKLNVLQFGDKMADPSEIVLYSNQSVLH